MVPSQSDAPPKPPARSSECNGSEGSPGLDHLQAQRGGSHHPLQCSRTPALLLGSSSKMELQHPATPRTLGAEWHPASCALGCAIFKPTQQRLMNSGSLATPVWAAAKLMQTHVKAGRGDAEAAGWGFCPEDAQAPF